MESKGVNPVVQQWALGKLIESLDPFIKRLVELLLNKETKPLTKTEEYIHSLRVEDDSPEDLYQDICCAFIYVLRNEKLNNTERLYDYTQLMFRQLFNREISLQDN